MILIAGEGIWNPCLTNFEASTKEQVEVILPDPSMTVENKDVPANSSETVCTGSNVDGNKEKENTTNEDEPKMKRQKVEDAPMNNNADNTASVENGITDSNKTLEKDQIVKDDPNSDSEHSDTEIGTESSSSSDDEDDEKGKEPKILNGQMVWVPSLVDPNTEEIGMVVYPGQTVQLKNPPSEYTLLSSVEDNVDYKHNKLIPVLYLSNRKSW